MMVKKIRPIVLLTTIIFLISVQSINVQAQNSLETENSSFSIGYNQTSVDSIDGSLLNRITQFGYLLQVDYGFNANTSSIVDSNPYSDLEVKYYTTPLLFHSFTVSTGIFGDPVLLYRYEASFGDKDFASEAIRFNEDKIHGLEKYTFGVNFVPVADLLIPGKKLKWLNRLTSIKFRRVKRLSQISAEFKEVKLIRSGGEEGDDFTFETISNPNNDNINFTFRTRYYYDSISWLLFHNRSEMEPPDNEVYGYLGFGWASWNFSRPFFLTFPPDLDIILVSADVKTNHAFLAEFGIDTDRFFVDVMISWGIDRSFDINEIDLDELLLSSPLTRDEAIVRTGLIEANAGIRKTFNYNRFRVRVECDIGIFSLFTTLDILNDELKEDFEKQDEDSTFTKVEQLPQAALRLNILF